MAKLPIKCPNFEGMPSDLQLIAVYVDRSTYAIEGMKDTLAKAGFKASEYDQYDLVKLTHDAPEYLHSFASSLWLNEVPVYATLEAAIATVKYLPEGHNGGSIRGYPISLFVAMASVLHPDIRGDTANELVNSVARMYLTEAAIFEADPSKLMSGYVGNAVPEFYAYARIFTKTTSGKKSRKK